jgi:hypothetical protein
MNQKMTNYFADRPRDRREQKVAAFQIKTFTKQKLPKIVIN